MDGIKVRLIAKVFVINNRGEILLLQRSRSDNRRPLGWDLPGGGVDYNEDPNQAVLRELQEEAGITATNPQVFFVASETTDSYVVSLLYKALATSTDVTLSFEHEQYKWIMPEEIIHFGMPQKYTTSAMMLIDRTL